MNERDSRDLSRRGFLRDVGRLAAGTALTAGAVTGAGLGSSLWTPALAAADGKAGGKSSESLVRTLQASLSAEQKKAMVFPFDHPLRRKVANNWHIVDGERFSIGKFYSSDQQEIIRGIFRGLVTEDGYERFERQMKDDSGGFGNYTCALFDDPETRRQEFVFTGRHLTLRADGDSVANAALGGPIFYGHAVAGREKPDHPGNVWWHQGKLANEVFEALDGKQRERALLKLSPDDDPDAVALGGRKAELPGIGGDELSRDQKALLEKSLRSLLDMFRPEDVREVMRCVEANGGLDSLHMSFYREDDIGADGVWDRWKIEGPSFAWYFRGSPHVHVWLDVRHQAEADRKIVEL